MPRAGYEGKWRDVQTHGANTVRGFPSAPAFIPTLEQVFRIKIGEVQTQIDVFDSLSLYILCLADLLWCCASLPFPLSPLLRVFLGFTYVGGRCWRKVGAVQTYVMEFGPSTLYLLDFVFSHYLHIHGTLEEGLEGKWRKFRLIAQRFILSFTVPPLLCSFLECAYAR